MRPHDAPLLATDYCVERVSLENLKDTPFEACGTKCVDGSLQQRGTLDQFHSSFRSLGFRYETPSAMCGYFSVANAILLSRELPSRWRVSNEELNRALGVLENPSVVAAEAERMMTFLQDSRRAYVDAHGSDFRAKSDVVHYMSDWVANYEISDYLNAEAKLGSLSEVVHFFRYNQMPEIESATHEERVRLEDERRFGLAVPGGADCKVIAELEAGATRFFIERCLPGEALLRPEQWAEDYGGQQNGSPPVFIVDVNDHFVVAVPLIIEPSSSSQGGPTLLVVNTTRANYLHSPALVYLFDLAFGVQK